MELQFRDLYADEIELRVGVVKDSGFTLLLYKNARVDMALLDEVVGVGNWQREHKILGNDIYCRVGIYNAELKQWVWREDAGAEANTEVEKSKASDSFKRACVNFGLGRCLYSAPFVWIKTTQTENPKERYKVKTINYVDHKISELVIVNEKTGVVVYSFGSKEKVAKTSEKPQETPRQEEPNDPFAKYNDNLGTIGEKELSAIDNYYKALSIEKGARFKVWLVKYYGTDNFIMLSERQGKEICKKMNI